MKAFTEIAIMKEIEKINKFCERQTIRMNGVDERIIAFSKRMASDYKAIWDRLTVIEKASRDFRQPGAGAPIDPRIGHLCWVWKRGQYCKTRAFRITGVFCDGFDTEDNSTRWDFAEPVKPEEL